jgi:putative ABC transport system permease protein
LFPTIVVTAGVMLTVVLYSYIKGSETDIINANAQFVSGHLDVVTRAYAQDQDQVPNDLAYIGVSSLMNRLANDYPHVQWTPRTKFGGLIDVPDDQGETRIQGPAVGMAVRLLDAASPEREILKLEQSLVRGRIPTTPGEILVSDEFARSLEVDIDDTVTLISTTMYGSMATANFTVAGTIRFGVSAMDRGALIADISDIQAALDMEDAAGEVLGFFNDHVFRRNDARMIADDFNTGFADNDDEFAPVMRTLRDHSGLAETLDLANAIGRALIVLFVAIMSIVLWNAGLMGSLRRYGEIGVRLSIGETKRHIYGSLLVESLMIGAVGSLIGTLFGIMFSHYMQVHGIDISPMLKNASMMISDVLRARVTATSWVIGFIPGLAATFLGTAISGRGIFNRQTSQLAKEFES